MGGWIPVPLAARAPLRAQTPRLLQASARRMRAMGGCWPVRCRRPGGNGCVEAARPLTVSYGDWIADDQRATGGGPSERGGRRGAGRGSRPLEIRPRTVARAGRTKIPTQKMRRRERPAQERR